jgi:hypothetical protein
MSDTENEAENCVWHYTKMGVLEKIFPPKGSKDHGKIRIRFTNCRYTNDPSESLILKEFLEMNQKSIAQKLDKDCKEVFEKEIERKEKIFEKHRSCIFSTTYLKNSFAFWSKEYAGLDGIAIEFQKDIMIKELAGLDDIIIEGQKDVIVQSPFNGFHDVNYTSLSTKDDDDKLIKITSDFLNSLFKDYNSKENKENFLAFFLRLHSPLYKHESWQYERESRIVIPDCHSEVEFVKNSVAQTFYKEFDISVVKSITLGPDCGDERVEAIKKYLEDNGYNYNWHIPVSRSTALDLRYISNENAELWEKLRKIAYYKEINKLEAKFQQSNNEKEKMEYYAQINFLKKYIEDM